MKKILIVEDEEVNRIALTLLLRHVGFDVEIATYGGEMLAKMDGIDIILTDINMPYLNGVEATNIARTFMYSKVPIMAMTGLELDKIPQGVFSKVFQKPFDIKQVVTALREAA